MPAPHVQGHLEYLWRPAYASGVPTFNSEGEIEAAAEWAGEPGVFAKAVTDVGTNFVDALMDGTYEIHDFWMHAPNYVKSRKHMEKKRRDNSRKFENVTNSYKHFENVTNSYKKFDTPAPAPAPAPNKKQNAPTGASLVRFEEWYSAYPVKKAKADAITAWNKLKPDDALIDTMLAAITAQIDNRAKFHAADAFIENWAYPATWLNKKRWNDVLEEPHQKSTYLNTSDPPHRRIPLGEDGLPVDPIDRMWAVACRRDGYPDSEWNRWP